jgi:membrane-bound lytic murein transglycosylase MltF
MEKHDKLHIADRSHVDDREFVEQLDTRIGRLEESFDRLEKRLSKQEHWQSFVLGAAAAIGAFITFAMTMVALAQGLLK